MKRVCSFVQLLVVVLLAVGCSIVAGTDNPEQNLLPPISIRFIETLRNQASLRSESFKEFAPATNPADTLQRPGSVYANQFRVYVIDTLFPGRVFVFDRAEKTAGILKITPRPSDSEGKLLNPSGIAVDQGEIIFVSDAQQGRVFGYTRSGNVLFVIGRPQSLITSHTGIGDLPSPSALTYDKTRNRLYVADTADHQIKAFSTVGDHLFDIGRSGNRKEDLKFPEAVTVDPAGTIYVVDGLRFSVILYDPAGKFQRSFSLKSALAPGQSIHPKGIAVDSDGHIYVTDVVNNNIHIYNNDGSPLTTWGRTGVLFGEFWTPSGIFIDDHDVIYVADQTNGRIQVFQYGK